MSGLAIHAASYLGPDGFGNDRTGLQPWPAPCAEPFRRGDLTEFHWSRLFSSDPSRFARMDLMSRLGLAAAELLEAGWDTLPPERRERFGVCLETSAGSLATDVRFLRTPKPTLFTYTLPSTVIGEICIRYRLQGPVLCLVSADPSESAAVAEAIEWLEQGDAESCLCLRCEVIDCEVPEVLPWPNELPALGWQAAALVLGAGNGRARPCPLSAGGLVDICRRLCAGEEGT